MFGRIYPSRGEWGVGPVSGLECLGDGCDHQGRSLLQWEAALGDGEGRVECVYVSPVLCPSSSAAAPASTCWKLGAVLLTGVGRRTLGVSHYS